MNRKSIIFILIVIAAFIIGDAFFFIVSEVEQVVVTEFGQPIGEPIKEAGIHFKPFWRVAHFFDKRIMRWDGEPRDIPTKDKKFIFVDPTARWRIVDPLKFLQSVRDERNALSRLDDILDSTVRTVITAHPLIEMVRSHNNILEVLRKEQAEQQKLEETETSPRQDDLMNEIKVGREGIHKQILEMSAPIALKEYGIEIVDVRIKRINYEKSVRENVYNRMISERKKEAERYRSMGHGRSQKILGEKEKELKKIASEAYRKAREIEGLADAEATKIYASAYNKDPEFYSFMKTLESYQQTIDNKATLILSTDGEYFKYLKKEIFKK
ncbi:MAG: protease modulator HflC [Myxococcota bacterium]